MNKSAGILIFLLAGAVLFSSCGGGSRRIDLEKNGLERLADHIREGNIIQTPFSKLMDRFTPVEEILSEKMQLERSLSSSRQKVWAATTDSPVLGLRESQKPPKMEVWMEEKPLPHFSQGNPETVTWKWIQTHRKIDLRFAPNYNKARKCLVLRPGTVFNFEAFLPDGPAVLKIQANRNNSPVGLEIRLDDKVITRLSLKRSLSSSKIDITDSAGIHSLSLKPFQEKSLGEAGSPKPKVSISFIQIETEQDVVLFFVPAEKQSEFSQSNIRSRYLHNHGRDSRWASLYRIQNDFLLHSFSHPENPFRVKKKIEVENSSLDILMAPPVSRYAFDVKIPEQAFLEFGTGIFRYPDESEKKSALFQITASDENSEEVLYQRSFISLNDMKAEQLKRQKIDLSRYAGRTIQLTMRTEKTGASSEDSGEPVFAFWSNPLISRPDPEGLKVILVSLDTLRADHLGSYGYSRNTSPYLDQLARDSVVFENVYAQSSWTLPSHMSLLFSLNTAGHGVFLRNQSIDKSVPSLASYLRSRGFAAAAFTGGGYMSSIFGFPKGFDRYDEPAENKPQDFQEKEAEYLFETAAGWLERNQDKKFFLFLHTFQIHGPYKCPFPWNEAFLAENHKWREINLKNTLDELGSPHSFSPEEINNIIALYDGEIKYTDEVLIKTLVGCLKELGIYDETLLIITSDHGEEFYEHDGWLHGFTLYNEQLKVPLIIKLPQSRNRGSRVSARVRLIDVMPTVLDWVSIKPEDAEGESLMNLINQKEDRDRIFISDLASITHPEVKPLKMTTNRNSLKFIYNRTKSGIESVEIYDLEKDPGEQFNLFPKARKLNEEVLAFLNRYYEEKKKQNKSGEEIQLDQKLKEKLKALGYLR